MHKLKSFFAKLFQARGLNPLFISVCGFTLAEVLITLGIIGVVASITIPVLMNNIQDAQFKTSYKKAYSAASQALNKANADYLMINAATSNTTDMQKNFITFMNQFKVSKSCISNNNEECWNPNGEKYGVNYNPPGIPVSSTYAFVDSSGISWSMAYSFYDELLLDTNGFKGPNQWGKDRFFLCLADVNGDCLKGLPIKVIPVADCAPSNCASGTNAWVCYGNKCTTQRNYYGTSWLYN